MKINKRERSYLRPAIIFGWEIYIHSYKETCEWDGDTLLPVKVGAMAKTLINKGLLEKVDFGCGTYRIRATKLLNSFKCRECCKGELYDDDDNVIGKCKACDGIGALLDNT